jgi:hypothetical protein
MQMSRIHAAEAPPNPRARVSLTRSLLCLPVAVLMGCAGPQTNKMSDGQTEAELLATMGQPTGRYPLPNGEQRVEYAKGPLGKYTFMYDLDKNGRIKKSEQVLTRQVFGQIKPNMTRDEVQLILGRPGDRQPEYMGKETWSWRYANYDCLWAQVTFSPKGYTTSGTSFTFDPLCDATQ